MLGRYLPQFKTGATDLVPTASRSPLLSLLPRVADPDASRHGTCPYCRTFLRAGYVPTGYSIGSADPNVNGFRYFSGERSPSPGLASRCGRKARALLRCSDFLRGVTPTAGGTTARDMVEPHFGPATIFESGPAAEATELGCGVDHVHFHIVPLGFSLFALASRQYPELCWQDCETLEFLTLFTRAGSRTFTSLNPTRLPALQL